MITVVIGGAASGKTQFGLSLGEGCKVRTYIATAELHDAEMRDKAARHRLERGDSWRTIEEPLRIADVLPQLDGYVLVDCLTLWLSNWLLKDQCHVEAQIEQLRIALGRCACDVALITNEVGCSVVPANSLGRTFRDVSGKMNQRIVEIADTVHLLVAGLALRLK